MNKNLYKIEIWLLKIIPFVLAIFTFAQIILCRFGIATVLLTQIAFTSYIPILFLYVSSYVFKYCEYHRIPLHYLLGVNVMNTIHLWWNFPITELLFIWSCVFGIITVYCGILKWINNE